MAVGRDKKTETQRVGSTAEVGEGNLAGGKRTKPDLRRRLPANLL